MKHKISQSHVAILVPSLRKAAEALGQLKFKIGEEESFEETREIYVQGDERNALLLMEPKAKGSYRKALEKRGPGLHHLAIDVLALESFLQSLSGSGWLLHLNSLRTIKELRTAYLARPGFPGLIEVQEKKKLGDGPLFVEKVSLRLEAGHASLLAAIGLESLLGAAKGQPSVTLRGRRIPLKDLI